MRETPRRVLRVIGSTLLTVGFVLLAYIAWLVWGTGVITGRAQDQLRDEFNRPVEGQTQPVALRGDAIANLRIPRIDLDLMVVEGTDVVSLKKGPGHYPDTAYPWQKTGRVGIAGHRTTYGAPFWSLDRVRRGDEITLATRRGTFEYEVTGSRDVAPTELGVLRHTEEPTLVLTTCSPRFSAARRLIVFAKRVGQLD